MATDFKVASSRFSPARFEGQLVCWTLLLLTSFVSMPATARDLPESAAVAVMTPGPVPVRASSCADLTKMHPDTPCSFDFSKFRTSDERLTAIEIKGISGSGLFGGKIYLAHDVGELDVLGKKLAPGDQLVLADGIWRDVTIKLVATGKQSQPIIIRPATPGGVTFTGTSSVRFWGANLIVHDFAFKEGAIDRDPFVVFGFGGGAGRPCNDCIADRIVIDDYNSAPDRYTTLMAIYMQMQGENITVANSEFRHKQNVGPVIHSNHPVDRQCSPRSVSEGSCFQRLLFVNNIVSDLSKDLRRRRSPRGKYKIMELGGGRVATASAFSVIEGNVFEHADGGTNTLSLKTSDVIIRNNRFLANLGTLNLRSANRVLIENNLFDGTGRDGMGGVLVQGRGHWIIHNRFKSLVKPLNDYHFPIAMPAAVDEDLKDGAKDYARVKDVVIAENIFEQVNYQSIKMGIFPKPDIGRSLQPTRVFLLNNVFSYSRQQNITPDNSTEANIIDYVGGRETFSDIVLRDNLVIR